MTERSSRYEYNKEVEENLTPQQIEFKRSVRERVIEARKCGVTTGKIANNLRSKSIHIVLDMIEAKALPMSAWYDMDRALKEIGF